MLIRVVVEGRVSRGWRYGYGREDSGSDRK